MPPPAGLPATSVQSFPPDKPRSQTKNVHQTASGESPPATRSGGNSHGGPSQQPRQGAQAGAKAKGEVKSALKGVDTALAKMILDEVLDVSPGIAFDDIVGQYMLDAHSMLQDHARNSREGAEAQGPACTECEEWVGYLDTQLENSRSRSDTLAMTDPLAPSLAEAFADRRYELEATRPSDYGTWLLSILMVMELDDDGDGIKVEFGN